MDRDSSNISPASLWVCQCLPNISISLCSIVEGIQTQFVDCGYQDPWSFFFPWVTWVISYFLDWPKLEACHLLRLIYLCMYIPLPGCVFQLYAAKRIKGNVSSYISRIQFRSILLPAGQVLLYSCILTPCTICSLHNLFHFACSWICVIWAQIFTIVWILIFCLFCTDSTEPCSQRLTFPSSELHVFLCDSGSVDFTQMPSPCLRDVTHN